MSGPTIRHKVCTYEGRLWVIRNVVVKGQRAILNLVDGDDIASAEMTLEGYYALNSALEAQEFSARGG